MRIFFAFMIFMTFVRLCALAQEIQTGIYAFDSKLQETAPGVSIVLPCKTKELKNVLSERLKADTQKSLKKYRKNIYRIENVKFDDISGTTRDYYFKIDKQGTNQSRLTMFAYDEEEQFVELNGTGTVAQNASSWMGEFPFKLELFRKNNAAVADANTLSKIRKRMDKLVMEHKKLEKALEENEKAQQEMKRRISAASQDAKESQEELERMRKRGNN